MSFFGAFFGLTGAAPVATPPAAPVPIAVPVVYGDAEYRDHAERAISRLCEMFKAVAE